MSDHESNFVRHCACDACGSSDANSLFDDGHTYCHSCKTTVQNAGEVTQTTRKKVAADIITEGLEVKALAKRFISEETCRHFGYKVGEVKGRMAQVAPYYDAEGNLVAQKVRFAGKEFFITGDISKARPFGSHAFQKTGKMIVVTEGEIDALSASQVQGNRWPVVSIPNGADSAKKHFANNLDYYKGFEKIVLMFDMDEPGRKAVKDACSVLPVGKVFVADLPLKDANEMLQNDRVKELVDAIFRAKEKRPDGVVKLSEIREKVLEAPTMGLSWFLPTLTKLTFGSRWGEIYGLGAGSGTGKTDLFTQQMKHDVVEHKLDIGVFSFEQGTSETARRLAGKYAKRRFHIPGQGTSQELAASLDALEQHVYLYDNFGACEWEYVKETIEYLNLVHGVRRFYLDNLTALAAAAENEKEAIEKIMAEMAQLAKRLDINIFFISHLSTPEKGSHEEGARVLGKHFKGSRSIIFWSHFLFALERNTQAEDPVVRSLTTFRILKDRYTGNSTGSTFYLTLNPETGELYECEAPKEDASSGFKDETQRQGDDDIPF